MTAAAAVSVREQRVGWERSNIMSPATPGTPHPPTALILQRATGQVSSHWLRVLHLGCLAFFSSPKWSSEFHVAGRVTGLGDGSQQMGEIRRGPGTTEAHNGLPRTRRRHTGPASCHLPFGMINPRRTEDSFVGPSLFNCRLLLSCWKRSGFLLERFKRRTR